MICPSSSCCQIIVERVYGNEEPMIVIGEYIAEKIKVVSDKNNESNYAKTIEFPFVENKCHK